MAGDLIEAVRNGVKIVGEQAGVDVEGEGGREMAEHTLNGFDVGTGGYGKAGSGVPQVVRRERSEPGAIDGGVET